MASPGTRSMAPAAPAGSLANTSFDDSESPCLAARPLSGNEASTAAPRCESHRGVCLLLAIGAAGIRFCLVGDRAHVGRAEAGRIARIRLGRVADFLTLGQILELRADDSGAMEEEVVVSPSAGSVLDKAETLVGADGCNAAGSQNGAPW